MGLIVVMIVVIVLFITKRHSQRPTLLRNESRNKISCAIYKVWCTFQSTWYCSTKIHIWPKGDFRMGGYIVRALRELGIHIRLK